MGLVAYCRRGRRSRATSWTPRARSSSGIGLGLVLGMVNGIAGHGVPGAVDRRDAGHAEHLPWHRLPHRRRPPGAARRAAGRLHGRGPRHRPRASRSSSIVAVVVVVVASVVLRWTRFGRQVYAVGSNPEAAAILGIPARGVVFAAFALCGLLAGIAGVMWVISSGRSTARRDRLRARRSSPRWSSAASTSSAAAGTVVGRGARRVLPGLRGERAHPRRALAVLAAGDLRGGHPPRGQRRPLISRRIQRIAAARRAR